MSLSALVLLASSRLMAGNEPDDGAAASADGPLLPPPPLLNSPAPDQVQSSSSSFYEAVTPEVAGPAAAGGAAAAVGAVNGAAETMIPRDSAVTKLPDGPPGAAEVSTDSAARGASSPKDELEDAVDQCKESAKAAAESCKSVAESTDRGSNARDGLMRNPSDEECKRLMNDVKGLDKNVANTCDDKVVDCTNQCGPLVQRLKKMGKGSDDPVFKAAKKWNSMCKDSHEALTSYDDMLDDLHNLTSVSNSAQKCYNNMNRSMPSMPQFPQNAANPANGQPQNPYTPPDKANQLCELNPRGQDCPGASAGASTPPPPAVVGNTDERPPSSASAAKAPNLGGMMNTSGPSLPENWRPSRIDPAASGGGGGSGSAAGLFSFTGGAGKPPNANANPNAAASAAAAPPTGATVHRGVYNSDGGGQNNFVLTSKNRDDTVRRQAFAPNSIPAVGSALHPKLSPAEVRRQWARRVSAEMLRSTATLHDSLHDFDPVPIVGPDGLTGPHRDNFLKIRYYFIKSYDRPFGI
ncbi:MAG: hypothetical protein C5B49_08735 [Bdellovibrio sp.]|nr:MAG: hypothetical protein C5B49_08735 [Bdellovibrio sp.]